MEQKLWNNELDESEREGPEESLEREREGIEEQIGKKEKQVKGNKIVEKTE